MYFRSRHPVALRSPNRRDLLAYRRVRCDVSLHPGDRSESYLARVPPLPCEEEDQVSKDSRSKSFVGKAGGLRRDRLPCGVSPNPKVCFNSPELETGRVTHCLICCKFSIYPMGGWSLTVRPIMLRLAPLLGLISCVSPRKSGHHCAKHPP